MPTRIPCKPDAGNGALIKAFEQITSQGLVGLGLEQCDLVLVALLAVNPSAGARVVVYLREHKIPNTPEVENFMNKQGLASTNALTPGFVAIGHVLDTGGVLLGEIDGFAWVG